jgi:signal recognition particle subunit SRP54
MGDVLSLIEKAQTQYDEKEAAQTAEKFMSAKFDLQDFLSQIKQIKKMGPLNDLLAMIPGFGKLSKEVNPDVTDKQLRRIEAIINSMTGQERRNPDLLNASRKRRVAKGSGSTVQEINQLIIQFRQMQKMMKQFTNNPRLRGMGGLFGKR